jgi:hypothetical protein
MKHPLLKSIWAILAGFILVFILSLATDFIMEKTGFMNREHFNDNPWWLIVIVIFYRNVYNGAGSYITARLAPNKPMKHVMIGASIGFLLGIIGTIVMWKVPPHWYSITLVVLTYPIAWLGGKLAIGKNTSITNN